MTLSLRSINAGHNGPESAPASAAVPAKPAKQSSSDRARDRAEADQIKINAKIERDRLKREARESRRQERQSEIRRVLSARLVLIPLIAVNAVAVLGQLAYLVEHLEVPGILAGWPAAILMATVLESIALFVQHHAAQALRRRDSAAAKQLAAYGIAGLVAAMNYSHFCGPNGEPTITATAFALCSAASPWLWGIHMRSTHRDELYDNGEIEPRVKVLSTARVVWHPIRAMRVKRHDAWRRTGSEVEADAVAAWETDQQRQQSEQETRRIAKRAQAKSEKSEKKTEDQAEVEKPFEDLTRSQQVFVAFEANGSYAVAKAEKWLHAEHGLKVHRSVVYDARKKIDARIRELITEFAVTQADENSVGAIVATLTDEGWPTDHAYTVKFVRAELKSQPTTEKAAA